jgi:hypothetical protein
MPREISDEDYAHLMQRKQVADFVETIYNDPELSHDAKALVKRKYPKMQIPDYDIEEKVNQRFAERDRSEAEAREAQRREADDAYWKGQRANVQKEYGFTDEGMQDLEKFMLEKNVGDYEVAARYRAAKEPKPAEPSYKDPYYNFSAGDTFKEIAKDPEAWGRNEILKTLNEQQNKNRNAF